MDGPQEGEAQQKEDSSKRHTYPLIRVNYWLKFESILKFFKERLFI